jgi:murein DD-endopeptidase MepM/ murein hydrolase activator NlpD
LWPVRGRVLASYGPGPDGTHNDGINIGAPRGAAVQAVDAGVVAYTGNELRGYGNLVLVKHANGWISAYAHCDQLLVKRGEKVTRGQVIARVGSTGNVGEPQLHFELRHGHKAVDPQEFLAPLPTAGASDSRSG